MGRLLPIALLLGLLLAGSSACASQGPDRVGTPTTSTSDYQTFPNYTRFTKAEVWEAYRFAAANPRGVLNYIPCYCGCVNHGDTSNYDCYINGKNAQGAFIFDDHAAG